MGLKEMHLKTLSKTIPCDIYIASAVQVTPYCQKGNRNLICGLWGF